jgi:hypothetical protein
VCLEAGKTASRHKTTTEIQRQNRQKGAENSTKKKTCKQRRVFPQPVKPAFISSVYTWNESQAYCTEGFFSKL